MPEPAALPEAVPSNRNKPPLPESAHILAIDDEKWVCQLLATALTKHGYHVSTADSAEDALTLLGTAQVDLIIADVRMAGMSGIDFTRIAARDHPNVPVVLMTGQADTDLARVALRSGAADFVAKPFSVRSIPIVVERNLERYRLHRQRINDHDLRVMFHSVQALAAAIDAKQKYTSLHSQRVTAIAATIGRDLNLPESEIRTLQLAAQVHDVGKIGIADEVLNKTTTLTGTEWMAVRLHPVRGAEIVSHVPELADVANVVRYHHERVDGHGYPDGLSGDEIPILSRIITVADAYEAMTSARPYRHRLSEKEAARRLQEGAGTQFDVAVVRSFDRLQRNGQIG